MEKIGNEPDEAETAGQDDQLIFISQLFKELLLVDLGWGERGGRE